eukprot:Pompholyxophrys_punicea_v1_NODE_521_length_1777_cov_3.376307.p1 type:complete len:208 gc:universal NODE_521_length_1777_cov_3.376307:1414-791(-)
MLIVFSSFSKSQPMASFEDRVCQIAKEIFKIESLKSIQLKAIEFLVDGKDVIVLSATGSGKSLIYGVTPFLLKKITVVISLQLDQCSIMQALGVKVVVLNHESQFSFHDIITCQLLYLTPEILITSKIIDMLRQLHQQRRLGIFVVDELHLVYEWGLDFREAYLQIGKVIRKTFPDINVCGLTATLLPEILPTIIQELHLKHDYIYC